jgi:anti-sigma B factor antagonist
MASNDLSPRKFLRHVPAPRGPLKANGPPGRAAPELQVDRIGDVTVVRFTRRRILTEGSIELLGEQLFALVERGGHRKLVLNFSNVDRMTTALLGKLIVLHKKVQAVNGWMVLCQIAPHLYEIFALFKLPQLFGVFEEGHAALLFPERHSA